MTTPDDTDTPGTLANVLTDLRDEIRGLRGDVQRERAGRRLTQQLAAVVIVVLLIVGAGWVADRIATADQRAQQACVTRHESRAEIRASMVAIAVYAGDVAGMDDAEASRLVSGAERIALETLPPPDC